MTGKKGVSIAEFSLTKNTKGLSAVVTTLLIILLSIVAIGIIWVVVRNVISSGSEQINLGQFTLDLSIKNAYIDGTSVVVGVRRSPGQGDLTGVKFVFFNGTSSSVVQRDVPINELEEKSFAFNSTEVGGISVVQTVSVAPVYTNSGKSTTGDVTDTADISNTIPPGAGSGDSGSGSGSGDSGTGDPGTGFCGDGLIQNPNGDSIAEVCDGSNLNSQTCSSLGFGTGTLSCTFGCEFDSSQCSAGAPSSCDGVWNQTDVDDGNECDGGANCQTSCTCLTGYSADGSGGCTLDAPIDTGIISTTWPDSGSANRFKSDDLPKSQSELIGYTTYYANFTGSFETGCFGISSAWYYSDINQSEIALNIPVGSELAQINPSEQYNIWGAENCGQ